MLFTKCKINQKQTLILQIIGSYKSKNRLYPDFTYRFLNRKEIPIKYITYLISRVIKGFLISSGLLPDQKIKENLVKYMDRFLSKKARKNKIKQIEVVYITILLVVLIL